MTSKFKEILLYIGTGLLVLLFFCFIGLLIMGVVFLIWTFPIVGWAIVALIVIMFAYAIGKDVLK